MSDTLTSTLDAKLLFSGKKITIDLTPLLPGGENGGAKLMTLELVNALAGLLPETHFVLLTAESSHAELEWLEKRHSNVGRICVLHNNPPTDPSAIASIPSPAWKDKVFEQLKVSAGDILPPALRQRIKDMPLSISSWRNRTTEKLEVSVKSVLPLKFRKLIRRWRRVPKATTGSVSLLGQIGASLLFCPFTAPFYADPQIPTVSVIYDLQYRAYPQFFTADEQIQREENFRIAYQKADYLVAISEFVRQTVIEAADLSPKHVIAVPIGLLRTPIQSENKVTGNELLDKYDLYRGEYIHYPANFWQHKNHAMLLTAFNMYRKANPGSTLKLLCTGAPGRGAEDFCEAARRMGLADWVIYPGYMAPDEYDFLLKSAFAMVFPSLYEGFGIPVLEAMFAGVPVLCSNVTSLPEVGGDAVLYFDPRKPAEIVSTLTHLSEDPILRKSLIVKGRQRALLFEGADRMAIQYVNVFAKALLPRADSNRVLDANNQPTGGELN